MKPIRSFEGFLAERVVKKKIPDKSRANFLVKETEKSFSFVRSLKADDENANSLVKLSYDLIMELIRAKMILEGLSASGQGAHEAEVAYLRTLGFSENVIQFANQLRYFRNRIMYYGKFMDKQYAENVLAFTKKIYPKLKEMI
ncbi:MAG: hypothetical protein KAT43_02355 [Nanoarchaeota archaeon]|nr:hypothetical protein [Nanoarchaeota archaeon]